MIRATALRRAHPPRHGAYPDPGSADEFDFAIRVAGHAVEGDEARLPTRVARLAAVLQRIVERRR
jgi:hypothetical protein